VPQALTKTRINETPNQWMEEMLKIRAEKNETKTKRMRQRINETRVGSLNRSRLTNL
jgi:hypothetical protein